MRRLKLEKITGVVALSYLILIPAGGFYFWKRIQEIDNNLDEVRVKTGMDPVEHQPIFNLSKAMYGFFGDR